VWRNVFACEGPDKVIRGEGRVNESQSKFLKLTWPMSQI
jgi:hypothetical protein